MKFMKQQQQKKYRQEDKTKDLIEIIKLGKILKTYKIK